MECLATFVLLVVLPLAAGAAFLAWRAQKTAKQTREEIVALRLRLEILAGGGVAPGAGAAPPAGADAAATTPATMPPPPGAPIAPPMAPPVAAHAPGASPLRGAFASGRRILRPMAAMADDAGSGAGAAPAPAVAAVPSKPKLSLEERLGARLPVWIGAIALVAAAAFLVKYSVDQGWIGPTVRVTLGALFGVALLVGGELLHRSAERIGQALTAAGVAVLFVITWAAFHLYHLIGAPAGFGLMALITATAVALALRHGPIVALIGLVGGFVTPILVDTGHPDARLLFAYLALLQAGLLAVARRRNWWPLSGLTTLLALAWAMAWSVGPHAAGDAAWVGGFLLLSLAASVLAAGGVRSAAAATGDAISAAHPWMRGGAALGSLVVAMALLENTKFSLDAWAFVGLLAAACLVLARLSPDLEALSWLAGAIVALLLADWAGTLQAAEIRPFLGVAAGAAALLGGLTWALKRGAAHGGRWAALATAATLAVDLAAWYGAGQAKVELPWGWIEIALAALWIALALPEARHRAEPGREAALAAAAALATTLVSLAVPMALDRHWLAVAWALEAAALVWLAGRIRVPLLLQLSGVLAVVVAVKLLLDPTVVTHPTGDSPFLSWLLYGYGVPIVALAVAAHLARGLAHRKLATLHGTVAVALVTAFIPLAIRQAYHPGHLDALTVRLEEWGWLSTLWLLFGCVLLRAALRRPLPELRWGGPAIVTLAMVQAGLAQALIVDPLWERAAVGAQPVLNWLLLVYGAPVALLLLAVSWERDLLGAWGPRFAPLPRLWSLAALLLLFLLVTLEVRQAFHGEYLSDGGTSVAENYSYSAAWVVLATALLVAGLAGKKRGIRLASLPVMLLAVGKVFLYDTANLSDLYRVFSFLGLGASLLLLAWLYQRFVFRARPEPESAS